MNHSSVPKREGFRRKETMTTDQSGREARKVTDNKLHM